METVLSSMSFDEFVAFMFDHPVPDDLDDCWRYDVDLDIVTGDEAVVVEYLTRLFRAPRFLLDRFSPEQIEQAFSFLGESYGIVDDLIWSKGVDLAARKAMILAMVELFHKLVAYLPNEDAFFMWWDEFASDFTVGGRSSLFQTRKWGPNAVPSMLMQTIAQKFVPGMERSLAPYTPSEPEAAEIQEAMFEALSEVLEIDSRQCQMAALHGLGHLRHPRGTEVIERFLDRHPKVDDELRQYACEAARGDVQ